MGVQVNLGAPRRGKVLGNDRNCTSRGLAGACLGQGRLPGVKNLTPACETAATKQIYNLLEAWPLNIHGKAYEKEQEVEWILRFYDCIFISKLW